MTNESLSQSEVDSIFKTLIPLQRIGTCVDAVDLISKWEAQAQAQVQEPSKQAKEEERGSGRFRWRLF